MVATFVMFILSRSNRAVWICLCCFLAFRREGPREGAA